MADRELVIVSLEITPDQRQQIEAIAQRRGYSAIDDYLRALIEADARTHGETLTLDDEDPAKGFREGWRDAMTGNIYPASTLWDNNFAP